MIITVHLGMIVQSGLKMQVACELANQWRAVSIKTVPYLGLSEMSVQWNATYPEAGYPDRLGHSG